MASKQAVEVVVVADRSGSMTSIAADAIGGYNTFLKEQQSAKGAANLTLVMFDDKYEVAVDSVPIKNAEPLTSATFVPRGSTALNDAIGRSISALEAKAPKKAIVCIITDGGENSSREFTGETAKAKIKAAEARGWQVVYLAANQDAFAVGGALGFNQANIQNFAATGDGVKAAYSSISSRSSSYRAS